MRRRSKKKREDVPKVVTPAVDDTIAAVLPQGKVSDLFEDF